MDPRQLEELRNLGHLLVPPTPEGTGAILPEAIAHASLDRPDELSTALGQPVTNALRDIARRDPDVFGEILAPTIGTAVRRAVADALAAILQRMNRVIESSISLRSLAWRLEARRKHRPFAEVMLSHTLQYRVEWAVLIHNETSLVLEQATLEEAPIQAPDQISALLQAISSFVSEAFQPTTPGANLHTLEVGDLTVWIDRDVAITLAVAIRGVAPHELRDTFRNTLKRIRTLRPAEIAERLPDPSKFAELHPLLVDCLRQDFKPTRSRAQWLLALVAIAAVVTVIALVVRGDAREDADAELRAAYHAALSGTPGTVVTSIQRSGDGVRIVGLHDPRAEPVEDAIAVAGLPPATLELAPYDSLDPRFEGPLVGASEAIRELETIEISFPRGVASVDPAALPSIERAALLVMRTQRAVTRAGASLCIAVTGNADETGKAAINQVMRTARAGSVAQALHAAGVPSELMDPRPARALRTPPGRQVTLRATLRLDPESPGCAP